MFQIDLLFGAILLCLQYVFMVLGIGCVIRLSNVIRKTHSLVCYNLKVNLSSQPDVNILQHRYVRAIQFFRFWLLKFTVAAHLSAHSLFFIRSNSLIDCLNLLIATNAIAVYNSLLYFAFQSLAYHKMCCWFFSNWWQSVKSNHIERQRKK